MCNKSIIDYVDNNQPSAIAQSHGSSLGLFNMSIAKNSSLLASKPLTVVMHTHKMKAHDALELHMYLMSPHSSVTVIA